MTRQGQIAHCKSKTLLGNFVCHWLKTPSLPSFPFKVTHYQVRTVCKPKNGDQNAKTGHEGYNDSVNFLPLLPMRHNHSAEIPINVDSAVNVVVSGNSRLGAFTNGTNGRPIRSICWNFCSVPVNGARFHAFASLQPTASGTKA